jgi:hypothetical protein
MFQTAPQTKRDLNHRTQRQKLSEAYAHTLKKQQNDLLEFFFLMGKEK